MDGLFGKGLFPVTRDSYARSAAASNRRSIQLLPVEKGPTTEQAPWMEDMVSRVQQVLTDMHILGDQHELDAMTLLLSMPGACQQDYHCDFPWNHRVFAGIRWRRMVPSPTPFLSSSRSTTKVRRSL